MICRAVLFDLDGTLLNTIEDLADSMNSVLARHDFPVHDLEAYKYFVGDGIENLVRRALPESHRAEESTVALCLASMREEYGRRRRQKTRPFEGVPELLDALEDRGIKVAILSNKPDEATKFVVKELLSRWRFEAVVGERPNVPRKPDPASAIEIAERLAIPTRDFLYVGDTDTDMRTANAAGMYAVGALWGYRKADELLKNGARALIERPLDVLTLL